MDTTVLGAPGGVIPGNDDEDFQVYDPEALANYGIMRMAAQGWWSPGRDWRLALRGTGQVANTRLLPVEQFAAGGYQTVRGITEREYFADNGWQSSLELYAPAITVKQRYQMRLLGFYDQAMLKNCGEDSNWLSSAGWEPVSKWPTRWICGSTTAGAWMTRDPSSTLAFRSLISDRW